MKPGARLPALILVMAAAMPPAALGESLTVTGISVTGPGDLEVSVPSVEAVDSNLDEAAIRALFDISAYPGAAESLATLDAASIVIPEIVVSYSVPAMTYGPTGRVVITYRNIALTGVTDGVASAARVGAIEVNGAQGATSSLERISTDLLDIGGLVGFYGIGAAATDGKGMRPVYRNLAIEGGELSRNGFDCTIGAGGAEALHARPGTSLPELMRMSEELEAASSAGEQPPPTLISKLLNYYADLFTDVESTPSTVDGFECSGLHKSRGSAAIKAGALEVGGIKSGVYSSIALDGFSFSVWEEGHFAFDKATWKPMDFNGPIAAIREAGDAIDQQWLEANWRLLIPAIEGFSLLGLDVDVPDSDRPGERVRISVGEFDVTLSGHRDGVPTNIATRGSDLRFSVPAGSDGEELRALGIETLEFGFETRAHWNEADRTIIVERLAFNSGGLGGVVLSGTLGNAAPELFSPDEKVAMVAAMGLTVTDLVIDVENTGFVPTLIAAAAANEGQNPQALHAIMVGMARAMPIAVLGGTPDSIKLSSALGAFFSGTPGLKITLNSTDARGISLAELMAAEKDPASLKGRIAIAAETSGEPAPFVFPEIAEPEAEPAPESSAPSEPVPEPVPAPGSSTDPGKIVNGR